LSTAHSRRLTGDTGALDCEAEAGPTEVELLTEIRDALRAERA
jgi:large-conductance mechanosensitive channel